MKLRPTVSAAHALRTLACLALLLFACAAPSTRTRDASGPDARQVLWQRSLDDALAVARAEGRPLLLAVNMDGESASDRIVYEEYRDPSFVAATRECVCLVASVFRHTPRDHDDQGRRIPCPRLGEVTCGEHMALEPQLFERFLSDGERVAPRHALILPDGGKAWDLSLCFDLHDIDRALFASVGEVSDRRTVDAAAAGASDDESWWELAALRDHRGRCRLEAALTRARDEGAVRAALDALAVSGDAGALDALRIVCAELPRLSDAGRAQLVATARALELARPLGDSLRRMVADPSGPAERAAERAVLLPVLAELDGAAPATRSLLLACRSLAEEAGGAARALQIAFGAATAAEVETELHARGGAVSLREVLAAAERVTRGEFALPAVGSVTDAMPEAQELELELADLDAELGTRGDDAELRARAAKAYLDLARRRIEAGAGGAGTLLEDAERSFALALDMEPERAEWWLERARTAYFLQRFADEAEYGRRALALRDVSSDGGRDYGGDWLGDALSDPLAIEALRWIGDGDARLLGTRSGGDPVVELAGIAEGLRALGAVAASRYGDGTDWTSLASFLGALGLEREAIEVASRGAERLPAAVELRQALNNALWNAGRIELAPKLAEEIASRNGASADARWHAGYAWMLAAEDLRRREACRPALRAYERARAQFAAAAERNPDWSASCAYYASLSWLGAGFAHVRLGARESAAECLVTAAADGFEPADVRDGLGYDVLDLIDKLLEWRDSGPTTVDALALLDRLEAAAPDRAFWATAVSDSELREALRADGRNPRRAERDSVDAEGRHVRQVMGLPWAEGDTYLAASIAAGRRALRLAATEEDRKPLAQACTIRAERQLELGRVQGVQAALAEAAEVLGFPSPPPDADEPVLRELARRLRDVLGEARPRFRPGR